MNNQQDSHIIYVCTSGKSQSGLTRIIRLLSADLKIQRIQFNEIQRFYNANKDDFKIILHNIGNVSPEVQVQSVVFGMQSLVHHLTHNPETIDHFRKHAPLQIWMNSQTAAEKLASHGFNTKVMYRSNPVMIPDPYIKMPDTNQVLWYWNENDPDLNQHWKLINQTVKQLPDIKFLFFPSKNVPIALPNTVALGKINIAKYFSKIRGMVRITNRFDMGRSMFDIAAGGRWVLTYKLKEPFTHAISRLSMLPDAIRFCLDNYGDKKGMELWQYARQNFTEDVLREKWVGEVKRVFGILNNE